MTLGPRPLTPHRHMPLHPEPQIPVPRKEGASWSHCRHQAQCQMLPHPRQEALARGPLGCQPRAPHPSSAQWGSPCSQAWPVQPSAQVQLPETGSQVPPLRQRQVCWQFLPNRPEGQAGERAARAAPTARPQGGPLPTGGPAEPAADRGQRPHPPLLLRQPAPAPPPPPKLANQLRGLSAAGRSSGSCAAPPLIPPGARTPATPAALR